VVEFWVGTILIPLENLRVGARRRRTATGQHRGSRTVGVKRRGYGGLEHLIVRDALQLLDVGQAPVTPANPH
jgi:hypothetical protein